MARAAVEVGVVELLVSAEAAARVANLTPRHRDPFDRFRVAQAVADPMRLYTADMLLPPSSELVTLVRA